MSREAPGTTRAAKNPVKVRAQLESAKARTRNARQRRIDAAIDSLVQAAPELTPERKAKLAALLNPSGGDQS